MRTRHALGLSILALILVAGPVGAGDVEHAAVPGDDARNAAPAAVDTGAPPEIMEPVSPLAAALRELLVALPLALSDREAEEQAAIAAFYADRADAPLWLAGDAINARALTLLAEIARAGDWGLDPADFALPKPLGAAPTPESLAAVENALTHIAMKYARFARGGRIMHPAQDLSSYLDRAPQLIDPKVTLAGLAATDDAGAYLRSLHPKHSQFEKLRQHYLALRAASKPARNKPLRALTPEAKRVLANMEQWRWMPADLGETYVWNNIPEYTMRVVKAGETIHTERIVAGLIGKQTPVFSRPMRRIVFQPKWKIPESIKVLEIWPSLVRSGQAGLMTQFGLRIETKDGVVVPTGSVDWAKADIRNYEVIQPPGPKSILGNIKFLFPNPHTVYMHDTQDKHLFAAAQRTYSHGCMRVRNPAKLAEVLLANDKGWDAAKIDELIKSGPLDNAIELDRRVPVHTTYFTASVGDDGKLVTFRDPYGHERRITLALEGRFNEINKGRDHLAPVEPNMASIKGPARAATPAAAKPFDFLSAVFSSGF